MGRLPIPGQDNGTWGNILNDYLSAVHNSDGTLKDDVVKATAIQDATISEDKLDAALAAKVNTVANGGVPDASTSTKGIVRLQGDLSGTADSPTVPGLATKANDNVVVHLAGDETIGGIKNFNGTLQAGGNAVVTTNDARLSDLRTPLNASVTPAKLVADTPASGEVLSYNGTGFEWVTPAAGGGGGEANTASNIGTAGVGVYKQKTGVNFEFKKINAASNRVTITDDTVNNELDIDVNQANLTLAKSQVGLGNVDNTSDANKPVSSAQLTALNLKADNSVTITGATSLTGGGNLTANRTLSLVGDSASPGNSQYYGTNGSGTKGFYALPGGGGDPTMGGDITGTASNAQIAAGAVGATEIASNAVTEPKLAAVNSPSTNQVLSWNGSGMAWTAQASGGGGTRTPYLMVASSQAPADVKAAADYVCNGTNDDVEINAALAAAGLQPADPDDFSSVGGYGKVMLSAGTFDITAPLLMRTGVTLEGMGNLTELRARGISTSGPNAIIALADTSVHLTRVTNMWLNGNYSAGNAHGIHYISAGGNGAYDDRPRSSPDASHWIDHLYIYNVGSSGSLRNAIWLEGASSGPRGCKLMSMRIYYIWGHGVYLQASDAHLTDLEVSTEGTGSVGIIVNGGNTILTSCKAWYCELDGFQIQSGRVSMVNCCAQDNGRWGFNITGSTANLVGGQADSNQRLDSSGGGVLIASSGTQIVGMSIFDRGQTAGSPQVRGIQLNGSLSNLRIDASVNVPSGSLHVVGDTSASSNLITIMRDGTTPLKVG